MFVVRDSTCSRPHEDVLFVAEGTWQKDTRTLAFSQLYCVIDVHDALLMSRFQSLIKQAAIIMRSKRIKGSKQRLFLINTVIMFGVFRGGVIADYLSSNYEKRIKARVPSMQTIFCI